MNLLKKLIKLANQLDEKGLYDEADKIDGLIKDIKSPSKESLLQELQRVEDDIDECLPQADWDGGWRLRLQSLVIHRDDIKNKLKVLSEDAAKDPFAKEIKNMNKRLLLKDELRNVNKSIEQEYARQERLMKMPGDSMRLNSLEHWRDSLMDKIDALENVQNAEDNQRREPAPKSVTIPPITTGGPAPAEVTKLPEPKPIVP